MSIFARFGSPNPVVADNVPFYSIEFRNFGKAWNFEVITSSPNYQQSNGSAEKCLGICKKFLKKCVERKQSPYISLLEYRNTHIEGVGCNIIIGIKKSVMNIDHKRIYYF